MNSKPLLLAILFAIPVMVPTQQAVGADSRLSATRSLQRQQQMDAASLSMGQSLSNAQAANLDSRQRLQLQQLELQQRMQQQTLEQQQLRQSYQRPELPNQPRASRDGRVQIEQQRLSQERQQQLQRFEWERQQQLQQFQRQRQQESLNRPLAPPQLAIP